MRIDLSRRLEDARDYLIDRWDKIYLTLFNIGDGRRFKKQIERLGLTVSSAPAHRVKATAQEFRALLEAGNYDAIAARLDEAFKSKRHNDCGDLEYNICERALLPKALLQLDYTFSTAREAMEMQAALKWFDDWIERRPGDPFAAAAVARAYGALSAVFSNYDRGKATDAQFRKYAGRELELLRDTQGAGRDSYVWNKAFYEAYYEDDDPTAAELDERFERVLAFDPDNIDLYLQHTGYHRDIWGGSPESLEAYARQSMGNVQNIPPEEIYARIYIEWLCGEGNSFNETRCDWSLMKQGLERMAARFSNPCVLNYYAYAASEANDHRTVLQIFRERMKVLVPDCWDHEDPSNGYLLAMYSYEDARAAALEEKFEARDNPPTPWGEKPPRSG